MPRLRPIPARVPAENSLFENKDDGNELFDSAKVESPPPAEGDQNLLATEAEPGPPKQEEPSEADLALKKQLDALRQSEEKQRKLEKQLRREQKNRYRDARNYSKDAWEAQKTAFDNQVDTLKIARRRARDEADRAQSDIARATEAGDAQAIAEATRRLTEAERNIGKYQQGLDAADSHWKEMRAERRKERDKIDSRRDEYRKARKEEQKQSKDPIDDLDVPDNVKIWLKDHRDYTTDNEKWVNLQASHFRAIKQHTAYSEPYLRFIEDDLGMNGGKQNQGAILSAPVSREGGSSINRAAGGRVTLTRDEQEAARMAGITDAEYARQKQKFNETYQSRYGERR